MNALFLSLPAIVYSLQHLGRILPRCLSSGIYMALQTLQLAFDSTLFYLILYLEGPQNHGGGRTCKLPLPMTQSDIACHLAPTRAAQRLITHQSDLAVYED